MGLHTALPGIVVSMLLLLFLPRVAQATHSRERFDWASLRAVWRPMTVLYFLVLIRSIVQITFTQFLPLYLRSERHYSGSAASLSLCRSLDSASASDGASEWLDDMVTMTLLP